MCSNNQDAGSISSRPAEEDRDTRPSALQFVRKLSGFKQSRSQAERLPPSKRASSSKRGRGLFRAPAAGVDAHQRGPPGARVIFRGPGAKKKKKKKKAERAGRGQGKEGLR